MGKKSKKHRKRGGGGNTSETPTARPRANAVPGQGKGAVAAPDVVERWNVYFKRGELEDWRRLMRDLGFEEDFPSVNQCRKALKGVWVNIHDFLNAVKNNKPVRRFKSEHELSQYTINKRKFYPNKGIPKGSPLRRLMARINWNRSARDGPVDIVTNRLMGLSLEE
ncbi:Uu.00g046040.m01.CDS01 [Anthostomella pinea]|uniref:Uu.00g046040.m01.CDS01 n=1 Tax=Anthostomella pinea TaxID=933095 RepID=A0AAI8YED4_9PEZI|nr:Uu.00g046040.m01.CDS01 [Anthostomella pinea]